LDARAVDRIERVRDVCCPTRLENLRADAARARRYAAELVALAPDVILAPGSAGLGPMLQATRDIPIVFVHTNDRGPRDAKKYSDDCPVPRHSLARGTGETR